MIYVFVGVVCFGIGAVMVLLLHRKEQEKKLSGVLYIIFDDKTGDMYLDPHIDKDTLMKEQDILVRIKHKHVEPS